MSRLEKIGETAIGVAAALAIFASLYIFFAPLGSQSITATSIAGEPGAVEESTTLISWFQAQGWWGVFVLVVFAGLFVWAYALARRGAYAWLGFLASGLVVLSYLTGFSIGLFYLPATVVLVVGVGALYVSRRLQPPPGQGQYS